MLQAAHKTTEFENDGTIPGYSFLDFDCKEEIFEEEIQEKKDVITDGDNDIHHFIPWGSSVPECFKIEADKSENNNECGECFYLEPKEAEKLMRLFEVACINKNLKFQAEKIDQINSLYPSYNKGFSLSLNNNSYRILCSIIQEILKERWQQKSVKKKIKFHFSQGKAEQIVLKRKQDRERKARQRAQETEEQRNLRREKERLAKAARRAAEPLEKKLKRREKDRIAKALSRAQETEEQRKRRLEKNRKSTAIGRATLSEEEKFIRRETERIKKANIRAFETEEQKRIRRERNRLSKAIKRANLNKEKKDSSKTANSKMKTWFEKNAMKHLDILGSVEL